MAMTDGGLPPEHPPEPNREDYMADEYHDRFLSAREYLRDGHPPEDAAEKAALDVDLFLNALRPEDPEDIRGTNRTKCDGCGEKVAQYVHAAGGSASGRGRNGLPMGVSWCAWDDVMPTEDRPDGWRNSLPSDGFPCPHCGAELDGESVDIQWREDYEQVAHCPECSEPLRGEQDG